MTNNNQPLIEYTSNVKRIAAQSIHGSPNKMLNTNLKSILFLAEPGFFCDSLESILLSYDFVQFVKVVPIGQFKPDDDPLVFPDIILVDCAGDSCSFEKALPLRTRYPHSKLILIVENYQKIGSAMMLGANGAIVKGFSSKELYAAIQEQLIEKPQ